MRSLDVPALLLWGPRDPVFSARYLRDLRARLPHADVHRFEGAGHLVVEDADVAGAVLRWLDARDDPAPTTAPHEPFRALGATLVERAADQGTALIELAGPRSRRVTWAALAARTDQLARGLAASGVRPGDRVALLVPPGADLTAVLYACLRLGAVVVVADAGLGVQGLTRAVRAAEPSVVIGIERALVAARWLRWAPTLVSAGPLRAGVAKALGVSTSLDALAALGRESTVDLPWPDADADAAILFTSGSTGPAKGVAYTHRRLAAMRDVVARTYGIGPDSPLVAAFAPFVLAGPRAGRDEREPGHGRDGAGDAHGAGARRGGARDRRQPWCSRRRPRCGRSCAARTGPSSPTWPVCVCSCRPVLRWASTCSRRRPRSCPVPRRTPPTA